MRIGFTGSQSGMTLFQKIELEKNLTQLHCTEFHHGDCIGSDIESNKIAKEMLPDYGILAIHPAIYTVKRAWSNAQYFRNQIELFAFVGRKEIDLEDKKLILEYHEPRNYLVRNQNIVDVTELLIACPKEFGHTLMSGTWATIRRGWKKMKIEPSYKVIIIPPIRS